jgi:hypothetical protein
VRVSRVIVKGRHTHEADTFWVALETETIPVHVTPPHCRRQIVCSSAGLISAGISMRRQIGGLTSSRVTRNRQIRGRDTVGFFWLGKAITLAAREFSAGLCS